MAVAQDAVFNPLSGEVWLGYASDRLRIRRINTAGPTGAPFETTAADGVTRFGLRLAANPSNGNVLAVWQQATQNSAGLLVVAVFGRLFDSGGNALGGPVLLSDLDTQHALALEAAATADHFLVVMRSQVPGTVDRSILGLALDPAGNANSDWTRIDALTDPFGNPRTVETFDVTTNSARGTYGLVLAAPNDVFFQELTVALEPTLSIADATVTEGDTGTVDATFAVSLSAPSQQTVTVDFATADGTAVAGSDYTTAVGTLTFTPGELTKTITVKVTGDIFNEQNETFFVNLSNPINAKLARAQGTGTIIDNDAVPSISINNASVTEPDTGGTTSAIFTVSLSAPSGKTVMVNFATSDGTAKAGSDYVASAGTATLAPGETSRTITVIVNGDNLNEANEQFFVTLTNPGNAVIATGMGTGTIIDNDAVPSISIDDVRVIEGNSGTTTSAMFRVSLSAPSGQNVTVDFATSDGTAKAGSDYVANTGALTFAPGETSRTITVTVNADNLNEPDEDFFVTLGNPTNATIARGRGTGTIVNDDALPMLAIDDVRVIEGNSGPTTSAMFMVRLSAPSGQIVTADYVTSDGTARAGSDYVAATGALTFAPGETSRTITVTVNGDLLNEADETFVVTLTNPINAMLADAQGIGTIINDDDLPTISIGDANVMEGNTGPTSAVFMVTLSPASGQTVSVNFATSDGTAKAGGPAAGDNDYVATAGTLVFVPGETSQTITVTVNGDDFNEMNEKFTVTLAGATNATLGRTMGTGTIMNDDALPSLSIDDVRVIEGNSGTTTSAMFRVSLSAPSGQIVSVDFATADGTGTAGATAGSDYVANAGTLSFPPGVTGQSITVIVNSDDVNEADEKFFVTLSNPINATIAKGQGTGTIVNDDVPTIARLVSEVGNLALGAGTQNSLTSKLRAAEQSLGRGNRTAAINQLGAFINELEALARSGRLDPATAAALIDLTRALVGSL